MSKGGIFLKQSFRGLIKDVKGGSTESSLGCLKGLYHSWRKKWCYKSSLGYLGG